MARLCAHAAALAAQDERESLPLSRRRVSQLLSFAQVGTQNILENVGCAHRRLHNAAQAFRPRIIFLGFLEQLTASCTGGSPVSMTCDMLEVTNPRFKAREPLRQDALDAPARLHSRACASQCKIWQERWEGVVHRLRLLMFPLLCLLPSAGMRASKHGTSRRTYAPGGGECALPAAPSLSPLSAAGG